MAFKKKIDIGNGEQFKFEQKGQALEGYYVGSFDHVGDYAPTKKHIFQTDKGLQTVFGQTHLTQLLEGISPGCLVRVTLTGTKKLKKGNPMKLYELEYDEDQTMDVDAVAASSSQVADEEESYEEEGNEDEGQEEVEEEPAPKAARPAQRPAAAAPARAASAPKSTVSPEQRARANALLGKRN